MLAGCLLCGAHKDKDCARKAISCYKVLECLSCMVNYWSDVTGSSSAIRMQLDEYLEWQIGRIIQYIFTYSNI